MKKVMINVFCLCVMCTGITPATMAQHPAGHKHNKAALQTVYTPQQLLNEETYKAVFNEHETGRVIVPGLVGVITEAGGRNGDNVYVRITKNNSGITDGDLGVGHTAVITLKPVAGAYRYMGPAKAHALKALMVKGRRIAFNVLMEGNQPFLSFAKIAAVR